MVFSEQSQNSKHRSATTTTTMTSGTTKTKATTSLRGRADWTDRRTYRSGNVRGARERVRRRRRLPTTTARIQSRRWWADGRSGGRCSGSSCLATTRDGGGGGNDGGWRRRPPPPPFSWARRRRRRYHLPVRRRCCTEKNAHSPGGLRQPAVRQCCHDGSELSSAVVGPRRLWYNTLLRLSGGAASGPRTNGVRGGRGEGP